MFRNSGIDSIAKKILPFGERLMKNDLTQEERVETINRVLEDLKNNNKIVGFEVIQGINCFELIIEVKRLHLFNVHIDESVCYIY